MSHHFYERRIPCRWLLGVVAALSLLLLAPGAAAAAQTTFSGQATVLSGTVAGQQLPCLVSDPVSTSCAGVVNAGPISTGATEAHYDESALCYGTTGSNCLIQPPNLTGDTLSAEVLRASVHASGNTSRAVASVADFGLNVGGQQISASALDARARATCTPDGAVVQAGAETTVTINGQTYTVAAGETRTVKLVDALGADIGLVTINEGASAERKGNEIDASALHIQLDDNPATPLVNESTDLYVAKVHADVVCGQSIGCPGKNAFVTGGGFIGSGQHFTVGGRNLERWGHVTWKPTRLHVKKPYAIVLQTKSALLEELKSHPGFDVGTVEGLDHAKFEGAALLTWYAQDGSVLGEALAIDMGEPGNQPKGSDFFQILEVGKGSIGAGFLQGGNIQMHGKCV